jgi:hypothetical protein
VSADAPTPTAAHVEVSAVQWCSSSELPRVTAITAEVLREYQALGFLGGA